MKDFRLGFPPVLLALDPEPRKSHVTPPRDSRAMPRETFDEWEFRATDNYVLVGGSFVQLTEADCRQVKHEYDLCIDNFDDVDAACKFKPGDRVRVINYLKPGSFPYGDGDEGVVIRASADRVICHMDKHGDLKPPNVNWDSGGCLELISQPSTRPAGVWSKTSEMKPPKDGLYKCRYRSETHRMRWSHERGGFVYPLHDNLGASGLEWEWLDESPSPQADAEGWIPHIGNTRPVPAGVRVRMKWSGGTETEAIMGEVPGNGWSCDGFRITHYRVVPQ